MNDLRGTRRWFQSPASWRSWVEPRQVGLLQATAEALLGWIILGSLSGEIWWRSAVPGSLHPRGIFNPVAWLWLLLWPLWRLRPISSRTWWLRVGVACARMLLLGGLLALLAWTVQSIGSAGAPAARFSRLSVIAAGAIIYTPPALCVRALLAAVPAIWRWVRSKLYRQLVVSHLAVILITLVALTAGGICMILALAVITWPDAATQASAVTNMLPREANEGPVDATRAQETLISLNNGNLRPAL